MYLYFLLPYKPISKFELASPPPTLEDRIPACSFGTPKTFRMPQNTTYYVRLNKNERGECIKPKWAMVASHTARRTCITNMYLAKKPDGSAKYTLAERMSVSGHKTESQYIKYIKCSLDEVAEMVAAANAANKDNLF